MTARGRFKAGWQQTKAPQMRVDAATGAALLAEAAKKKNKYGAEKFPVDDHLFDSKKEANRYAVLKLRQRAGEISDLRIQPKFEITCGGTPVIIRSKRYPNGRRVTYRADFSYIDHLLDDQRVVEDTKGEDTYASRVKRALVEAEYGIKVLIT